MNGNESLRFFLVPGLLNIIELLLRRALVQLGSEGGKN